MLIEFELSVEPRLTPGVELSPAAAMPEGLESITAMFAALPAMVDSGVKISPPAAPPKSQYNSRGLATFW